MGGVPAPRSRGAPPMTYGRSNEHALDAFHIDRADWSSLAADRAAWRETLCASGTHRAGNRSRLYATSGASASNAPCGHRHKIQHRRDTAGTARAPAAVTAPRTHSARALLTHMQIDHATIPEPHIPLQC